jgi:hypothetical protein
LEVEAVREEKAVREEAETTKCAVDRLDARSITIHFLSVP